MSDTRIQMDDVHNQLLQFEKEAKEEKYSNQSPTKQDVNIL